MARRRKQAPKTYTKSISFDGKGHESKGWNWQCVICAFVISMVVVISFCSALIGQLNPSETFTQKNDSVKRANANIKPADTFRASFISPVTMINTTIKGRNVLVKELFHDHDKSSVRLYQVDEFLSKEECDAFTRAHLYHVQESNKMTPLICFAGIETFQKYLNEAGLDHFKVSQKDFVGGTLCINETFSIRLKGDLRWSFSTAFYRGESKFSFEFEKRLEDISSLQATHGGKFQITSYPKDIGYKSHTDCNIDDDRRELRDRFATALVYLQNVRNGGETKFTKLGISVKPKQGRLIIWNNMDDNGKCDSTSVHEAAPVIAGRKYILQRWYYYQNFPQLGLRIEEPARPPRKMSQPRVSCDIYEEGSCRWYDEWGYDHLVDYRQNQHNFV